jgi:hypothetical protein
VKDLSRRSSLENLAFSVQALQGVEPELLAKQVSPDLSPDYSDVGKLLYLLPPERREIVLEEIATAAGTNPRIPEWMQVLRDPTSGAMALFYVTFRSRGTRDCF